MLMRTEAPDGHLWQSVSEDEGATWKTAWRTPIYAGGSPPSLLRLDDGRLLCTYGYRAGRFRAFSESNGIRATVSRDGGETWEAPRVLRDDLPNPDIGYPSSVELTDGRILSVYWYNLFERYFLAGTFWRP
jgi:Neuraminidase (sialidase)